jgi:tripartite-type tricarboxylate transporter receptor subunit TctC
MHPAAITARALLACMLALFAAFAAAAYPERPIRLIISSAVGGTPEQFAAKWAEVVKKSGAKLD